MTDKKTMVRAPASPMNMNARVKQIATYAEGGMEDLVRYSGSSDLEKSTARAKEIIGAHKLSCMDNDRLAGADPVSHFEFLALAMLLDLVPGKSGGGQLWAVPYGKTVTPIVGHKGLMTLWHRAKPGTEIVCRLAYKGDKISYNPTINRITQEGSNDVEEIFRERPLKDMVGGYTVILNQHGKVIASSKPISLVDMLKRARKSQTYKPALEKSNPDEWWTWFTPNTPWSTWPEKMAEKTIVKMFLGSGQVSVEGSKLDRALEIDTLAEDANARLRYQDVAEIAPPTHPVPEGLHVQVSDVEAPEEPVAPRGAPQPTGEQVEYGEEEAPKGDLFGEGPMPAVDPEGNY